MVTKELSTAKKDDHRRSRSKSSSKSARGVPKAAVAPRRNSTEAAKAEKVTTVAVGQKHHTDDDNGLFNPPTSTRQRLVYKRCCNCTRDSACKAGKTARSAGCACVIAGRNCTGCINFGTKCARNPRVMDLSAVVGKGAMASFFGNQCNPVSNEKGDVRDSSNKLTTVSGDGSSKSIKVPVLDDAASKSATNAMPGDDSQLSQQDGGQKSRKTTRRRIYRTSNQLIMMRINQLELELEMEMEIETEMEMKEQSSRN